MKHNIKITLVLLSMFVITQFIGLYVSNTNIFNRTIQVNGTNETITNPILTTLQPPQPVQQSDFSIYFGSMIFAFIIAIVILFLLTKFKIDMILKLWFFVVVVIALFITFNAFFPNYINSIYFVVIALVVALVLGFIKIFRQNFIVHNLTELLIYPELQLFLFQS